MAAQGFTRSDWFSDDHAAFTDLMQRFVADEVAPNSHRWYGEGKVDRALWTKAGGLGLLAPSLAPDHGGVGAPRSFEAVATYEYSRSGDTAWGIAIQQCVLHYIDTYGTAEQKAQWLPGLAAGELVAALGMTEPSAGSDLQGIRTIAQPSGNGYRISGSKTFITNGGHADMICLVVKTDAEAGAKGVSLMLVDLRDLDGFRRGRVLKKIGMKGNDTAELFFDDVQVPASALLGGVEGRGFYQLMEQLPWERLVIGLGALGNIDFTLAETVAYAKERKAFGKRLMDQQNIRFKLAEVATKAEVLRSFVTDCVGRLDRGELDATAASMVKWWSTQTQCEIADECVQIFGGYGFMEEYPVARQYADARVQKIYGGTNEIMKELIARSLDRD
jgi:alkylation response protein AidB-like acyl-CoA dehydrogenase